MRFLCIVLLDRDIAASMTKEQWQVIDRDSVAYDDHLKEQGVFIDANALESSAGAHTIRIRRSEQIVTDGPFMETKEEVAGYILIDVPDIEAAVRIAEGIPLAGIGAVEVRPVMEFEPR